MDARLAKELAQIEFSCNAAMGEMISAGIEQISATSAVSGEFWGSHTVAHKKVWLDIACGLYFYVHDHDLLFRVSHTLETEPWHINQTERAVIAAACQAVPGSLINVSG